jgi:hypothetical protein
VQKWNNIECIDDLRNIAWKTRLKILFYFFSLSLARKIFIFSGNRVTCGLSIENFYITRNKSSSDIHIVSLERKLMIKFGEILICVPNFTRLGFRPCKNCCKKESLENALYSNVLTRLDVHSNIPRTKIETFIDLLNFINLDNFRLQNKIQKFSKGSAREKER